VNQGAKRESRPIRVAQVMGKMLGGGVEAVVMNYYRHIDRSQVQFDFLVDADSTRVPRDEIEFLGGRVFVVPPYQKPLSYQRELVKLFAEQRWPIVHSHINTLSVFPLRAAQRAGVPVRIAHSHSTSNPNERAKTALKDILRTQANRYPTTRFACGQYAGEWLFGKDQSFTVMPNAIDLQRFKFSYAKRMDLREKLGIDEGASVVLHMGRFVEQKNHKFLIDVFSKLLEGNPTAVLLLAGEGPLRPETEQIVDTLGIANNVLFLGQRSDADALYCAADVFCLPSLYEGLPVVAVEAQASGLPIIMSDQVTHEALITSRAKMIPLDANTDAWADEVSEGGAARLAEVSPDDREAISRYDIQNAAPLLVEKYIELANKAGVKFGQ
jgi:glycosyltransferase involved in cell wall biosynthesis